MRKPAELVEDVERQSELPPPRRQPGADADRKAIPGRPAGVNGQVVDEFMATGAVVAGRGTFERDVPLPATCTSSSGPLLAGTREATLSTLAPH